MNYFVSSSGLQDQLQLFLPYFVLHFFTCICIVNYQIWPLTTLNILPHELSQNMKYCRHLRLACKLIYLHTGLTLVEISKSWLVRYCWCWSEKGWKRRVTRKQNSSNETTNVYMQEYGEIVFCEQENKWVYNFSEWVVEQLHPCVY